MNRLLFLFVLLLFIGCKKDIEYKVVDGWTILFDGTSYKHWRGFQSDKLPDNWVIEEGAMAYKPDDEGGNTIVTKKQFKNFVLSLEWKISKGGNSGIFWGVSEDEKFAVAYQSGPEVQIRDNEMEEGTLVLPKHRAGAIFDIVAPKKDVVKPIGEWNSCQITVDFNSNKAVIEMNNTILSEFALYGEEWEQLVNNSKFKELEGFAEFKTGYIGLQDHGNNVWYRNIKIKEL